MQSLDTRHGARDPDRDRGASAGSPTRARRPRPRPTFSQVLGEVFLTVGALVLAFAFYESYWTNVEAGRQQAAANEGLDELWQSEGERVNPRGRFTPELGEAFARMYIPSFGSDFHFAVIEGTDEEELLAGPGRYTDSQMPGEAGNFAVAGHRVGKGAPFNDLGNLRSCDAIVVETFASWNVYRVMPMSGDPTTRQQEAAACFTDTQVQRMAGGEYAGVVGRHITTPNHIEMINPVPGATTTEVSEGAEALITLTTCHPQFSAAERMIVHGMLVEQIPKTGGERPAVLEES
ncbi:class E sortase [Corynebacterium efficiens]|uniref:Putative membrane protein n=1 Tax=Corynebacterium efficiens (strain DSM 44549 / YS-314 / AJ 12310 / JCM 11189 / NBRC 100395) TaxID=196164 RepID=Q8FLS4_COREF|nr:putative membrane protein [Corynebacterium efficiens YS-314]